MTLFIRHCLAMAFTLALLGLGSRLHAQEKVSFRNQVAPLLVDHCLACHSPKKAEGGYRVDSFVRLGTAGDTGEAPFTAAKPDASELLRRLVSADPGERMPKDADPLSADQIALVKRWIEEGANFDGPDAKLALFSYLPPPIYPAAPEAYRGPVPLTAMQFSADGNQLFVAGYNEITVWNPSDGALLRRIGNLPQRIFSIAINKDGSQLAVTGGTPGKIGELRLIDAASGQLIKVLTSSPDVLFDAQYSPAGDQIATAAADGSIRVFDVASGEQKLLISSHADWVFAVAWNADGTKLASGSRDKTAKVFDAKTGDLAITYSGHNQPVRGVMFHPDGAEVYSASSDSKVHRWKIADAARVGESGFGGEVYRLVPGGEFFFTSSSEKKVRQFKAKDQQQVREFPPMEDWAMSSAVHLPSGKVAGGSFSGEVKIWKLDDGSLLKEFRASPGWNGPKKP